MDIFWLHTVSVFKIEKDAYEDKSQVLAVIWNTLYHKLIGVVIITTHMSKIKVLTPAWYTVYHNVIGTITVAGCAALVLGWTEFVFMHKHSIVLLGCLHLRLSVYLRLPRVLGMRISLSHTHSGFLLVWRVLCSRPTVLFMKVVAFYTRYIKLLVVAFMVKGISHWWWHAGMLPLVSAKCPFPTTRSSVQRLAKGLRSVGRQNVVRKVTLWGSREQHGQG